MKITPEMTAESGGALLDLADYQDDDGTGVKVTTDNGRARVKVDSYDPFGRAIHLDRADALGLGARLCEVAADLPGADWAATAAASLDGAELLAAWAKCAAEVAAAASAPGDVHALTVAVHMAAQDLQGAAAEVLARQRGRERWGDESL